MAGACRYNYQVKHSSTDGQQPVQSGPSAQVSLKVTLDKSGSLEQRIMFTALRESKRCAMLVCWVRFASLRG